MHSNTAARFGGLATSPRLKCDECESITSSNQRIYLHFATLVGLKSGDGLIPHSCIIAPTTDLRSDLLELTKATSRNHVQLSPPGSNSAAPSLQGLLSGIIISTIVCQSRHRSTLREPTHLQWARRR